MNIGEYGRDLELLERVSSDEGYRLRVYCPDRVCVVLGRASKPERELHVAACMRDDVAVLRRRGGGCAVILDPGTVVIEAAAFAPGIGNIDRHMDRFSEWLRRGVEALECRSVWRTETVEPSVRTGKAQGRGVAIVTSRTSNAAVGEQGTSRPSTGPARMRGRGATGVKLIGAPGAGEVARQGISDLVVGDRKISGSCLYRTRNGVVFTATVLVGAAVDAMEHYLQHPPREPDYRRGRSHCDFVANIGGDPQETARRLAEILGRTKPGAE